MNRTTTPPAKTRKTHTAEQLQAFQNALKQIGREMTTVRSETDVIIQKEATVPEDAIVA